MNFFFNRYRQLGQDPRKISLPKTIRINTTKIDPKNLLKKLKRVNIKKIPYLDYGYEVKAPYSMGATIEYLLGYYYIQEAAAQVPVQVLMKGSKSRDKILDMCAAPGGKTTQIAQYTKSNIIALDRKPKRLQALKNNVERLGVSNITILNWDGRKASELGKFDRILLDAPCSGNFVKDKEWFKKRTLAGIEKSAKIQYQLLVSAYQSLKKRGVLVYSTCSLEPEENELNIHKFLEDHPKCSLQEIKVTGADQGLTKVLGKHLNSSLRKTIRFCVEPLSVFSSFKFRMIFFKWSKLF